MALELLTGHIPNGVTATHYLDKENLLQYRDDVQKIADFITAPPQKSYEGFYMEDGKMFSIDPETD